MVILLMMALLMIALVAVATRDATEIRREREEETIHRGKEYAKAVRRYFRKFGRYPTRLEELENTNNTRFLRKRYTDPMTGEDFRILHFGEQKSVPKGLIGASLGSASVGTPAGGMGSGGVAGGIIGNTFGGGAQGGPAQGPGTSPGAPGQTQPPGTAASNISNPLGSGPTFGGGPIIGVAGTKNHASLKTWNDKTNYKDWEFYYDPRFEVMSGAGLSGAGGVPGVPSGVPGGLGNPSQNPNPNPNPQPQMPR